MSFYSKFRIDITTHPRNSTGRTGKGCMLQLHSKSEPSTCSDLVNVKNKFTNDEKCSNPQEQEAQIDADQ
jgi:hypothetical protein